MEQAPYTQPRGHKAAAERQQYLPDAIKDAQYYTYGDNKLEQKAKAYWDSIKK